MAKPTVTITASRTIFVGTPVRVGIDITTKKALKVDFIHAELVGDQGWQVGGGQSSVATRAKYPELRAPLMAAGVLPAATTTHFAAEFTLPRGTPPSHAISPAYAQVRLRVHISIPWHLDRRYDYELPIRVRAPREVVRTPHAIRSHAAANKPRLELGLASTLLVVGETLVGTCALFHVDDREPCDIELSLVPVLTLTGRGGARERRGRALAWTLSVPAGRAGTNLPFELPLPTKLTPSFETITHRLAWWLTARSGSFFGAKVEVSLPIELVDASATETAAIEEMQAAPRLGDERIAALFAQLAAADGWRHDDATDVTDSTGAADASTIVVARDAGDAMLHLAYSYRGERGAFLVARVDHLALGLGLSVTPSSSLRHVFFKDVEIEIAAWDRAHYVSARSAAQAIPFLRAVVPTLMQAGGLGTLVRWTDSELVFEAPIVSLEGAHLAVASAQLVAIAAVIAAAARTIAPPEVTTDLAIWRALATRLGAPLTIGDLSIDGTLDGLPAHVALTWNAAHAPVAVHVAVGAPEAASDELRAIAIALARPAHEVLAVAAADRLVETVTRWPDDFVELRVADGVASASYALAPTARGESPTLAATRVRTLVDALRAVLLALQPDSGPYR